MTTYSLRMLEAQRDQIAALLLQDDNEAAVIALCGRSFVRDPWTGDRDERFLINKILPVPTDAYSVRTPTSFTWSTTPFYTAVKEAEAKGLAVAVFHSHPNGPLSFSEADDVAEREMFQIAFDRLESDRPHLSIVMDGSRAMIARAYDPKLEPITVQNIVVIGQRWRFDSGTRSTAVSTAFDRQVRAFGDASIRVLSDIKIGVVGCGGTGSAVVSLLTRIGVRNLALFDADHVDQTNLNRLQFACQVDATLMRRKVDVVAEGAARVGLPMSIVRVPQFADHPASLAVLRACDLVFGCTDDDLGREVLNRLAHFYLIPVIDLGLLIEPGKDGGYDTFDGRVTVIQPGSPCQGCRGLIGAQGLQMDALRRDPDLLEQRRRAGYVPYDDSPSPVVVTFTTEVATMAVNELFHRLNGFRGEDQQCSERVRRFDLLKDSDQLPAGKSRPGCKLCDRRRYDGRGDMAPLLDITL